MISHKKVLIETFGWVGLGLLSLVLVYVLFFWTAVISMGIWGDNEYVHAFNSLVNYIRDIFK